MLMRVTHGIKEKSERTSKAKLVFKKKVSKLSKEYKVKLEKQKKQKEYIDPQLALYQEIDIRVAL